MSETGFVLRQRRSFGETLNATFSFVRIHARVLLMSLLQLVLPLLIVVAGLVLILVQIYIVDIEVSGTNFAENVVVLVLFALVCFFLLGLAFALASAVYYAIVRLALQHGADFEVADVRRVVKSTFWSLVGMFILISIIGTVISYLLLIPFALVGTIGDSTGAILFSVLFAIASMVARIAFVTYVSLAFAILVIESQGITNAIQRSIRLVRGYFWQTFGLVVVITLIVYLMMLAPIAHPVLLATLLTKIFDPVSMTQWLLNSKVVVELASTVYGLFVFMSFFFVWMFPTTAISLHYISLVEIKEGIGLAMKVNALLPAVPVVDEQREEDLAILDSQTGDESAESRYGRAYDSPVDFFSTAAVATEPIDAPSGVGTQSSEGAAQNTEDSTATGHESSSSDSADSTTDSSSIDSSFDSDTSSAD